MATAKLEQINTFLDKLEAQQTLLTTITDLHKTLTTHFTNIDKNLSNKSETIDTHIKTLKENTDNALVNLQNRENALPNLGSSMAVRIEEMKFAAINEIENGEKNMDMEDSEKSLSEELTVYCKRMDATGLVTFIQTKRKEPTGLRKEIASALESCVDPMRLILDAAEEFVRMKMEGKAILADRRWACDMLIQSVVPVAEGVYGAGTSLKERAARLLEKWKGVLGGGDRNSGVCAAEATMILQLVIAFALKERFEEKFLKKLVLEFANRKDMPKLAVAYGFGNKIGDIIEELVKSGKEVEAVYFASESGLTERFPPLPLLNSALSNCRKNANNISRKGNLVQLQWPKQKRKRAQLQKRGRGSGTGKARNPSTSRPVKSGRYSNVSPSFRSRNPPQSHQVPPARYAGAHSYTSQSVYEAPSTVSYAPAYSGTHTNSSVALPPQYGYALQEAGAYSGSHSQSPTTLTPRYGYALQEAGASGLQSYHGSYGGETGYSAYDYTLAATTPAYPPSYPQQ
ncbi:unnamed protein product [Withania somnifera]